MGVHLLECTTLFPNVFAGAPTIPNILPNTHCRQKQTLFAAFLGAPTILTACFMAFPLSMYIPHVLPNAPIVPHCPLSPFLPFLSFCCHSCCLITIHVLLSPYLSFSVSSPCHHSHCVHCYVTILIVPMSIFVISSVILIILSSILPSWHFIVLVKTNLGQLQTTMSHCNQGLGHV